LAQEYAELHINSSIYIWVQCMKQKYLSLLSSYSLQSIT